ncbi:MAG: hypothetical protein ACJAY3_000966, partial [Neolewinella sp.]
WFPPLGMGTMDSHYGERGNYALVVDDLPNSIAY